MAHILKLSEMLKSEIDEFLDLVSEGGILFERALEDYLKEEQSQFTQRLQAVSKHERRADELRKDIEKQLYLKTLIPENRGDVLAILENTDEVIDTVKETLTKFSVERPQIDKVHHQLFLELGELSVESTDYLVRAIRAFFTDYDMVNDYIHKVGFYEHEVDETAVQLKRKIFESDLSLSRKMHLRFITENVEAISDCAEAVSDRLAIYTIKRRI
ncbi:MAG: DUF47 domain-containing protein [Candidatus Brocadiia bacterium]